MKFKVGDIIVPRADNFTGTVIGVTNDFHPYNIQWDHEKTPSIGHSTSYIESNFTLKYPRNSHTKLGKVLYK